MPTDAPRRPNDRRADASTPAPSPIVSAFSAPNACRYGPTSSAASLYLALGVPVRVTQRIVGHADPAMTMRICAHAVGRFLRRTATP